TRSTLRWMGRSENTLPTPRGSLLELYVQVSPLFSSFRVETATSMSCQIHAYLASKGFSSSAAVTFASATLSSAVGINVRHSAWRLRRGGAGARRCTEILHDGRVQAPPVKPGGALAPCETPLRAPPEHARINDVLGSLNAR